LSGETLLSSPEPLEREEFRGTIQHSRQGTIISGLDNNQTI